MYIADETEYMLYYYLLFSFFLWILHINIFLYCKIKDIYFLFEINEITNHIKIYKYSYS